MRHSLAVFLLLTLVACSSDPSKEGQNLTADELYAKAQASMQDENYEKAVKQFETLQSRYPYGRYAQQAQMEIAYAYYKHSEPAPAIAALDHFAKMYPMSTHLDYVLYLKGLINFNENINSLFGTMFKQDPSERDPSALRESFNSFKELVTRFPDSKYAPDAKLRMQYLLNSLASSEIHIASYYLRRGAYVAAANRAKSVLIDFPNTPQTREALQILVQAYDAMGMEVLRDDTQRVLSLNVAKDGNQPAIKETPRNSSPWWEFWD
ncbi:outer membrane protein assembly factor BamD [Sideroxydans lithotrophicus]|uniref:Outer membrane protein assembly factor BamD n=1 Tax=Sideroxydans lithotrophicus (strain ES-1) TaxID=580332 RepID=D5CTV5_SIDLE|nr:outer membrane protein assembly factor BamD [Sideroxydans lithotrophicus]ADE12267.1 outer membrane assembly lipoprotein YfiO [Sideroxydans lithotrophicus ES-1]